MTLRAIEVRLTKTERRLHARTRGIHRYSDDELGGLIAALRQPIETADPDREAWAVDLLRREGLLP